MTVSQDKRKPWNFKIGFVLTFASLRTESSQLLFQRQHARKFQKFRSKEMQISKPHTSNYTCNWLQLWTMPPLPPPFPTLESQYLAQWFWSLWTLKKYIVGKSFTTDANVKQAVTSCLQTFKSLRTMVWWDTCLNVNGDNVKVSCAPSATNVLCINLSQNKVLSIRMFVTLTAKTPLGIVKIYPRPIWTRHDIYCHW
jgi:hypothetical protein